MVKNDKVDTSTWLIALDDVVEKFHSLTIMKRMMNVGGRLVVKVVSWSHPRSPEQATIVGQWLLRAKLFVLLPFQEMSTRSMKPLVGFLERLSQGFIGKRVLWEMNGLSCLGWAITQWLLQLGERQNIIKIIMLMLWVLTARKLPSKVCVCVW